ncbi:MAG: polysaccharide biosynthesis tyrosine autokinase [Caldilineales bacterium]|nr:polysaccharide biosynthesis tyrosine autokinase [Caldilineales bacterium]
MELKEYILPLRKWWWLIIASTLVATVSSIIATRQQAPIYQTHATMMIGRAINDPNPTGNEVWLTQQLATTYIDIAQRAPVQDATREALGLSWLPDYTLQLIPSTQLIELAVTDTDPVRAQAVANELVNQIVLQSPSGLDPEEERRQGFINEQLASLERGIQETQTEIDRKQAELADMFSARQIADTQTQIQGLQSKLSSLQGNYAALLANTNKGAINTINVIEWAALPTSPIGPNSLYTILLAAAIGFMLAAGAAHVMEYLDDTLKNPDDVYKELELTTLGAVPDLGDVSDSVNALVTLKDGQSPGKEAYRVLRTNLQFAAVDKPLRQILITSPSPSEGKSITAANLGIALAQADERVIVIDADLHRPRLHRLFKLTNNVGLTTALLDEHPDPESLLQETTTPGLRVLTSGPLPPNPAELLGSSRMRNLISTLQGQADVLVFDSPPTTVLADAAILSTQVDGVLFVLKSGATKRDIARRAAEALSHVNARIVGVLLNAMPSRGSGYYYYYYYYNKSDYYDSDHGDGGAGGLLPWRRKQRRRRKRKQASAQTPTPQPVHTSTETN